MKRSVPTIFDRSVLFRNVILAVCVGSVLTLVNQFDALFSQSLELSLSVKIAMNYLIPFIVASLSVILNQSRS